MAYSSLRECIRDLESSGQLRRVTEEVDPYLEMAEIQRRVFAAAGPALLFTRVKGCAFPCAANLYGTKERARYILRHGYEKARNLMKLASDPGFLVQKPLKSLQSVSGLRHALPLPTWKAPVLENHTSVGRLPQIHSWPKDGGAFITLPQVYSEHTAKPGIFASNLGMYRVQLSGGQYEKDKEVGFHYQLHRGIGVHHQAALARGEKLKVSIFVGGPPSHGFAAVMPLPEGMPEICFAGLLGGRNFRYMRRGDRLLSSEADFCLTGYLDTERMLPEGPFGDHLGYYSAEHEFPVLRITGVYHREGAVWPFTVVGRPPQEDTVFGELIHELAGPMVPRQLPGIKAVHAVDDAGVHPLLLAIGSERYVPYEERKPRELLTQANALLGYGQISLAKYVFIAAGEDNPDLDINDVQAFLSHVLERVDWTRDLHFQTKTTMDTLDYSGGRLNEGSKVVIAAAGPAIRSLRKRVPQALRSARALPAEFNHPELALPGVLVLTGPTYEARSGRKQMKALAKALGDVEGLEEMPLICVVDDSKETARTLSNFLWTVFTRSDPAADIEGVHAFSRLKHWGCRGSLLVDARSKPHHAPPLESDPDVVKRVLELGAAGGSLHGLL